MMIKDFVALMAKVAIGRQVQPLNDVELEVYYDELGIYEDFELREAASKVMTSVYHVFPTVGEFTLAICGDRTAPLPPYNVHGRHEDYLPKPMRADEFHVRRKRGWVPDDVQVRIGNEQRQIKGAGK